MFTHKKLLLRFTCLFVMVAVAVWIPSCGDGGTQGPVDNGGKNDTISGVDTIPPATVLGLVAKSPRASSMALVWISPGDDGASGQASSYDIRYSRSSITDQNWDAAIPVSDIPPPSPAGQIETVIAGGLPSEADLYFALKTRDEIPNESGLSNCTMNTTLDMGPWPIEDLKAKAVSETEFLLTWTATGDDGKNGTASYYDIRYSTSSINDGNWYRATSATGEPVPRTTGERDSFTVTGLVPGTNYYFAMKIGDEVPNWSFLSNVSPAFAYGVDLWVTPQNVKLGEEMQIAYRSSPTEVTRVNIWGQEYTYPGWQWRIVRHLVGGTLPADVYVAQWDLRDDDGDIVASWWAEQFVVKLTWGETVIDTISVRVLPSN